jgi:proline dehydrogenase
MQQLYRNGVGGILDFAAEDDVDHEDGPASRSEPRDTIVARTYNYDTEAACDSHTRVFLQSIAAAAQGQGQGFAAVKVPPPRCPSCLRDGIAWACRMWRGCKESATRKC